MDKILHDPKDPKLWELWYIPYYGSCRILSINRRPPSGPFFPFGGLRFLIKLSKTKNGALFVQRLLGIIVNRSDFEAPAVKFAF